MKKLLLLGLLPVFTWGAVEEPVAGGCVRQSLESLRESLDATLPRIPQEGLFIQLALEHASPLLGLKLDFSVPPRMFSAKQGNELLEAALGRTPEVKPDSLPFVREKLRLGANPEVCDNTLYPYECASSPLDVYISKGYLGNLTLLLSYGAKLRGGSSFFGRSIIGILDNYRLNPLHRGLDVVQLLIFFGADVNKGASSREIPIIQVVRSAQVENVEFLLENGVSPLSTDEYNNTARHFANFGNSNKSEGSKFYYGPRYEAIADLLDTYTPDRTAAIQERIAARKALPIDVVVRNWARDNMLAAMVDADEPRCKQFAEVLEVLSCTDVLSQLRNYPPSRG